MSNFQGSSVDIENLLDGFLSKNGVSNDTISSLNNDFNQLCIISESFKLDMDELSAHINQFQNANSFFATKDEKKFFMLFNYGSNSINFTNISVKILNSNPLGFIYALAHEAVHAIEYTSYISNASISGESAAIALARSEGDAYLTQAVIVNNSPSLRQPLNRLNYEIGRLIGENDDPGVNAGANFVSGINVVDPATIPLSASLSNISDKIVNYLYNTPFFNEIYGEEWQYNISLDSKAYYVGGGDRYKGAIEIADIIFGGKYSQDQIKLREKFLIEWIKNHNIPLQKIDNVNASKSNSSEAQTNPELGNTVASESSSASPAPAPAPEASTIPADPVTTTDPRVSSIPTPTDPGAQTAPSGPIVGGVNPKALDITDVFPDVTTSITSEDGKTPGDGSICIVNDAIPDVEQLFDPLVIDVNGNGFNLIDASTSKVYLKSDSDFAHLSGWVGSGSGILCVCNPDNSISMLGSDGTGWSALSALDSNGDGVLDSSDPAFQRLVIWQDVNGDGIAQPGELKTLSALGIVSIDLQATLSDNIVNGNHVISVASVTMADGSTRQIADVGLAMSNTYTFWTGQVSISPTIATLPSLRGYGTLISLQDQMSFDPTLLSNVQSFVASMQSGASLGVIKSSVDDLMFKWAGVDTVDPESRGGIVDARRLGFIERYLGQNVTFQNGYYGNPNNPGKIPALQMNSLFVTLENGVLARLMIQADPSLSSEFTYDKAHDAVEPANDLISSLKAISEQTGYISGANLDRWEQISIVLAEIGQDYAIDNANFASILQVNGVPGLDVLVGAVSQGLNVNFDTSGHLVVTGTPNAGLLVNEQSLVGQNYYYGEGDGIITVDYAAPYSTLIWQKLSQANPQNVLYVSGNSSDFRSTLDSAGNEILTDGNPNDQLTIRNEANSWDGGSIYGVQNITFSDGVSWSLPMVTAITGQTTLTSAYQGVEMDPEGTATNVTMNGNGNILDYRLGYGVVALSAQGWNNTIQFGPGISSLDVTLALQSNGDLQITDGTSGDALTILGNYVGWTSQSHISQLKFLDGTTLTLGTGQTTPFTYQATDTNTVLNGSWRAPDVFNLAPGNDTVTTGNYYATINYAMGDGNPTINPTPITGGSGEIDLSADYSESNVYFQAQGNNLVVRFNNDPNESIRLNNDLYGTSYGGASWIQNLVFADGITESLGITSTGIGTPLSFDWYADTNNTVLSGDSWGKNVFHLAAGGDTVWTSSGFSQFDYGLGDGNAVINPTGPWYNGSSKIAFDSTVSASNVYLQAQGNNLVVRFRGDSSDSIVLNNDIYGTWYGYASVVNSLTFSDGSIQTLGLTGPGVGIPLSFEWYADQNTTVLRGSGYAPTNVFHLAPGDDTVFTVGGFSQFDYGLGDGNVVIYPTGPWDTGYSEVALDSTVSASDVYLQANGTDLIVRFVGDNTDSITLKYDAYWMWYGAASVVQDLKFSDGTSYILGTNPNNGGKPFTFDWFADANTTTLTGSAYAKTNVYHLAAGGDTVWTVGNGLSVIDYEAGDGNAVVHPNGPWNGGSANIVITGYTASQTYLQSNGYDLIVRFVGNTTDSLDLNWDLYNAYNGTASEVGNIGFADGTSLSLTRPLTFTWYASEGNAQLIGSNWGPNVYVPGSIGASITPSGWSQNGAISNSFVLTSGDGHSSVDMSYASGVVSVSSDLNASNIHLGFAGHSSGELLGSDAGTLWQSLRTGGDFVVSSDDGASLTFHNDFYGTYNGVGSRLNAIDFSDGSSLSLNDRLTYREAATSSGQVMHGSFDADNVFQLNTGGDTVFATNGSTVSLTGSGIAATQNMNFILYGVGDGHAVVDMGGGIGALDLQGLNASDVSFNIDVSGDLLMSVLNNTMDDVTFKNGANPWDSQTASLQYVQFADGSRSSLMGILHGNQ